MISRDSRIMSKYDDGSVPMLVISMHALIFGESSYSITS